MSLPVNSARARSFPGSTGSIAQRRRGRVINVLIAGCLLFLGYRGWAEMRFLADAIHGRLAEGHDVTAASPLRRSAPAASARLISFSDLRFAGKGGDGDDVSPGPQAHFLPSAPAAIRALDGCEVRLRGYMMPMRVEGTRAVECLIVPSQLNCCYGQAPRFCEFVNAHLRSLDIPPTIDVPLLFTGTLHVGDVHENGLWASFYTLECTEVGR